MGVFFDRVVKKASYFTGGSVWQRNRLKKLLTGTKKKDRGIVFKYWLKTFRNVCQTTTEIVSRSFLGGDGLENFQRKLRYEKQKVCPKNMNSVQKHLLGKIDFRKRPGGLSELKKTIERGCQRFLSLAAKTSMVWLFFRKYYELCPDFRGKGFGGVCPAFKLREKVKVLGEKADAKIFRKLSFYGPLAWYILTRWSKLHSTSPEKIFPPFCWKIKNIYSRVLRAGHFR